MARPRARLDAAVLADAFAADGLHGTSSAALARAAGMAKPTLYVHGRSKEALFLRAVEAEVERVLDRLHSAATATTGRSARDRATAAASALLEHATARPAGARLLACTAHHRSSGVAQATEHALNRVRERLAAQIARDLAAEGQDPALAPILARALHGAAMALAGSWAGQPRPGPGRLAAAAASVVPPPPAARSHWPTA